MDLSLTSEQQSIVATANKIFADLFPLSRFHKNRALSPRDMAENRARLGELGFIGVCVPSSDGGAGLTLVEQMLICEAMGRNLAPLEIIPTMLAAELSTASDETSAASAFISGEQVAGIVFPECLDVTENSDLAVENWIAYGSADPAAFLISGPHAAGILEPGGISAEWFECLATELSFAKGVRLPGNPTSVANRQLFIRGVVLASAVLVGLSQSALDMAVGHAKTRVQFGEPIGVNQAIRHPCAAVAVKIRLARSQLYYAALAVEKLSSDACHLAACAKVLASEVALTSCSNNIQFHGGMGLTDEFPAHILLKTTHIVEKWFGNTEYHLKKIIKYNKLINKK